MDKPASRSDEVQLAERIEQVHPSQNYFTCTEVERAVICNALRRFRSERGLNWKSWTEHPPETKEPVIYPVLRGDYEGQGETKRDLEYAEWGPQLYHSGGSNWPDAVRCEWSKQHIHHWFPISIPREYAPQPSER